MSRFSQALTRPRQPPRPALPKSTLILTTALIVLLLACTLAAAQTYTFTDLGAFEPRAIAGPYVVGQESGVPIRLDLDTGEKLPLGHMGQGGVAESVIPTGEAVGTVQVLNAQGHPEGAAVFWDTAGTAFLLPGPTPSDARDLNESGTVAGNMPCVSPDGQVRPQAVRWSPAEGQVECLVGPFAQGGGVARAIDGQGRVWGRALNFITVWAVGQPGDTLDGAQEGGFQGFVDDANGETAWGSSENFLATGTAGFGILAVHFRIPGPATLLAAPAPVDHNTLCSAGGVNNAGVTVGSCARKSNPEIPARAFLWPDTETFVDLNTRVQAPYVLTSARGINDDGEIIGSSGSQHWLLTPLAPRVVETTPAEQLIIRLYEDLLGRTPDESELGWWSSWLTDSPSLGQAQVLGWLFVQSGEFQSRRLDPNAHVQTLYQGLLGRAGNADEIAWWRQWMPAFTPHVHYYFAVSNEFAARWSRMFGQQVVSR